MKTLKFGIEIETVGISREQLARAIQGVTGGTARDDGRGWQITDARGRSWRVVPDGSLAGINSGEIVSPILGYEDIDELQNIVRAVRAAGARSDASTGIHYARAVVMRSRDARPASSRASLLSCCA